MPGCQVASVSGDGEDDGRAIALSPKRRRPPGHSDRLRRSGSYCLALLEITRPATSVAAPLLAVLSVRLAAANGSIDAAAWEPPRLAILAVGWLMLAQAVFAVNDYFDAPIDAISHPWRAVPSGRVVRSDALRLGVGLGITGVAALAAVAPPMGLVGLGYAIVSWLYSSHLKTANGIAGNVTVAGLIAFVPASLGVGEGGAAAPAWFTLAIFLGVLAREVLNDIEDLDGDRAAGRPTIPLLIGNRAAYRMSAGLWLGFALAVISPAILAPTPRSFTFLAVMGVSSTTALIVVLALLRERQAWLGRLQWFSKVMLISPTLAMLAFPHSFV